MRCERSNPALVLNNSPDFLQIYCNTVVKKSPHYVLGIKPAQSVLSPNKRLIIYNALQAKSLSIVFVWSEICWKGIIEKWKTI